MPDLVPHLSAPELQARFVASRETRGARHVQAIWLLARGHSLEEVAETTAYSTRWVRRLIDRTNAEGPDALGDRRRANGSPRRTLTPEALAQVRERLADPPAPGQVWTCRKVAAVLATSLGRERVATGTGWAALRQLDGSLQQPRPHNPKAATPEAAEAFKKS